MVQDLTCRGSEGVDWVRLVEDRDQCQAVANAVVNI